MNGNHKADIRNNIEIYRGRLPSRFIPIGADASGNALCISITGADRGKIYFWTHEKEADPDKGESPDTVDNIMLVADSFDAFIAGLY